MRRSRPVLKGLALLLLAVLLVQLLGAPWYTFPPAQPFHGPRWHNPYADFSGSGLRANFHAHARTWGGVFYGTDGAEAVRDAYYRIDYDLPCISNYMRIAGPGPRGPYLPAYEHGFGLGQQHQTVLGADQVSWLDYPLFQTSRHKQHVLDQLTRAGAFVILNHPQKGGGYGEDDLRQLTGYHAIEVGTRFARSIQPWVAALDAGRRVWAVCADDSHNPKRTSQIREGWTIVDAAPHSAAILGALHAGRFYSVFSPWKGQPNTLRSCTLVDAELDVQCGEVADFIRFFGQGGELRHQIYKQAAARYALQEDDTYIRVEVHRGANVLYLNPVTRHAGDGGVAAAAVPKLPVWSGPLLGGMLWLAVFWRWFLRGTAAQPATALRRATTS